MQHEFGDALEVIARSNELRRLVGQFVIDEALGERFIATPNATLNDMGLTLQPDEIAKLRHVLLTLSGLSSSESQKIKELTMGADKVIK
jgi:hypothetical protein